MVGANLTGANLLTDVFLTGANLFDITLLGANMAVANFGSSPSLWGNNTKCPDTTFSQDNGGNCFGNMKYWRRD